MIPLSHFKTNESKTKKAYIIKQLLIFDSDFWWPLAAALEKEQWNSLQGIGILPTTWISSKNWAYEKTFFKDWCICLELYPLLLYLLANPSSETKLNKYFLKL